MRLAEAQQEEARRLQAEQQQRLQELRSRLEQASKKFQSVTKWRRR